MNSVLLIHSRPTHGQQVTVGPFCNVEESGRFQRKAKEGKRERIKSLEETLNELKL